MAASPTLQLSSSQLATGRNHDLDLSSDDGAWELRDLLSPYHSVCGDWLPWLVSPGTHRLSQQGLDSRNLQVSGDTSQGS